MPEPLPASRLIFRWPERSVSFLLPGFFLLAAAVHGVAFYLFQVVYPPVISSAPPRAQVWLLSQEEPRHRALLEWVEAQNPASALPRGSGEGEGMAGITYQPSYASVRTLPQPAQRREEPIPWPGGWPGADEAAAGPERAPTAGKPGRVLSSLHFSPSLAGRDQAARGEAPKLQPVAVRNDLSPTVFLVALSDRGEVRHLFLQSGSGHEGLDAQAEALLRNHPFSSRPGEVPALTWGRATWIWGADAVAREKEAERSER
ncbi:MAG TPA: hypothetical protein VNQ90_06545 [Chthoniobacteraceae bacterium]|nr:hypothetical protein [Chthoniobacteraceae bacterium]